MIRKTTFTNPYLTLQSFYDILNKYRKGQGEKGGFLIMRNVKKRTLLRVLYIVYLIPARRFNSAFIIFAWSPRYVVAFDKKYVTTLLPVSMPTVSLMSPI